MNVVVFAREFNCNNIYTSGPVLFCKRCRRIVGYVDNIAGERIYRLVDERLLTFEPIKKNVVGEKVVMFFGAYEENNKRKRVTSETDLWLERVHPEHDSSLEVSDDEQEDEIIIPDEYLDSTLSDYESYIEDDLSLYNDDWSDDSSQNAVGLVSDTPLSIFSSYSNLFMHENFNVLENSVGTCKFYVLLFLEILNTHFFRISIYYTSFTLY